MRGTRSTLAPLAARHDAHGDMSTRLAQPVAPARGDRRCAASGGEGLIVCRTEVFVRSPTCAMQLSHGGGDAPTGQQHASPGQSGSARSLCAITDDRAGPVRAAPGKLRKMSRALKGRNMRGADGRRPTDGVRWAPACRPRAVVNGLVASCFAPSGLEWFGAAFPGRRGSAPRRLW
jgi:hypothetical protein